MNESPGPMLPLAPNVIEAMARLRGQGHVVERLPDGAFRVDGREFTDAGLVAVSRGPVKGEAP